MCTASLATVYEIDKDVVAEYAFPDLPDEEDNPLPFMDRVRATRGVDWVCPETFVMRNVDMRPADIFLFASNVPLLSRRAATVLGDILGGGLILPIECRGGDYVAYRPPEVVGALDLERSDLRHWNEEAGYASAVDHWEFHREATLSLNFFQLRETFGFFGTGRFVNRLREHDLMRGITVELIWKG